MPPAKGPIWLNGFRLSTHWALTLMIVKMNSPTPPTPLKIASLAIDKGRFGSYTKLAILYPPPLSPIGLRRTPIGLHRTPSDSHRNPIGLHRTPTDSHRSPIRLNRTPTDSHWNPIRLNRIPTTSVGLN